MKTYTVEQVAKFNAMSVGLILQLCEKKPTESDIYNYYLAVLKDIEKSSIEKVCAAFDEMMLPNKN